ncbi:MAG: DUF4912 domain-containing protein [Deltaproteobacteria bacterium]|nr:DUF4912 domain-containing protein [Deltaproteobacteria bacterium]
MGELRGLSVRKLRDLARQHIGPGFSKIKTRLQLLAALEPLLSGKPEAAKAPAPRLNGTRLPSRTRPSPAKGATQRPKETKVRKKAVAAATTRPSASVRTIPPAPLVAPPFRAEDENLGELPESYGEDTVVLLPKDPHCLYLHWDFSPATLERAFAWMPGLRTRLRLFEGNRVVRELDFSVGDKTWYLRGLPAGRTYRVELFAMAEDGQARRIGPTSNPIRLPVEGPSSQRNDRFVRVPMDLPAAQVSEALRQGLKALGERAPAPPPAAGAFATAPGRLPPRSAAPVAPSKLPGAPSKLAWLVPFVEPPPFSEESRERIYEMSSMAARARGSSESLPLRAPAPASRRADHGPGED